MIEAVDAVTYRKNVQRVQAEAMAWGFKHRCLPVYSSTTHRLHYGYFEVFWDTWQTIGYEVDPMTPETLYRWDEDRWAQISAEAAKSLSQ